METKTKRSLIIWGVVILVLLNISSLGTIWYHRYQFKAERSARGNNMARGHQRMQSDTERMRMRPDILAKGLNLSTDQEQAFDSIWLKHLSEKSSIDENMDKNRYTMGKLLSASTLDTLAYMELSQHQTDLMQALNRSMLTMNSELRNLLTDEQRNLFLQRIEQLNTRMNTRYKTK